MRVCRFCGELRSICDRKRIGVDLAGARCAFLRELYSLEERLEEEHADRLAVADDFTRCERPPRPEPTSIPSRGRLVLG